MDHLNRNQLCKRCLATDLLDAVFDVGMLTVQPKLVALDEHLRAAKPAYILTIRKRSHVWRAVMRVTALREPVSQEHLDEMGSPRACKSSR